MAYREFTKSISENSIHDSEAFKIELDEVIDRCAHWLPTQGPIKDFIHHNTLHAVQHLPFHEGVAVAAKMFGARSYLPLDDYQNLYRQGRIQDFAIVWALKQCSLSTEEQEKLKTRLFETDKTSHYPPLSLANHGIRTVWLTFLEIDLNSLAHPVLFRLLGNFLDQGISRWSLAKNGEHFWDCVLRLAQNSLLPLYPLNEPGIRKVLCENPYQVIRDCLQKIVGDESLYEQYLLEMLLAHPGWSGMVHMIEMNPRSLLASREISLVEMLAVELAIELAFLHKKKGFDFPSIAKSPHTETTPLLKNGALHPKIPLPLKVWHEAMEWSLHCELLSLLKPEIQQKSVSSSIKSAPAVQALFCIDDRECGLRRYLEELHPSLETFGAAGFFGIDFLYQGLNDAYPVSQCPNIMTPKHLIKESSNKPTSTKKSKSTKLSHMHFSAHSLFRGWLYTQTLGIGYAVRMAWNVFRPGSKLPNIKTLSEVEAHSQLHLLRDSDELTDDGYLLGFSFSEMADRVGGLLRNIGLTENFARLVVIVAHGSSSVNNPHFAAYDCGACSGKPGAPNARAFAWMANHPSVRKILLERGIEIPDKTLFLAALHNTSRDEITYFDLQLKPTDPQIEGFEVFQQAMNNALHRNAFERCRWFELGPQSQSAEKAHEHVKERASSIFEPRPEYNHSNNLYCVVGRRAMTRGLFLDRRAFLHSYDPETDEQGDIVVRILSAIIPVCGGINLEYLFSRIDNSVYGAGTKLPHNVIGLLGVANGVEGDLRTGLPSQMIEVHEPARLLIIVEQTPDILNKAIAKIGVLREWLDNEWVRFIACLPDTKESFLYSVHGWDKVDSAVNIGTPKARYSTTLIKHPTQTIPVHQLIGEQI
jgi:uncharacterized protein